MAAIINELPPVTDNPFCSCCEIGLTLTVKDAAVSPRMSKYLWIHHTNESWYPANTLLFINILDSIFRWNDELPGVFSILGQSVKPALHEGCYSQHDQHRIYIADLGDKIGACIYSLDKYHPLL